MKHYQRGCVINLRVEAGEDPFDGTPEAYLRGEFIEHAAGLPGASEEERAKAGAFQRFAFNVREVDFTTLLDALGIPAVGSFEPVTVDVMRAEEPLEMALPILGFRSPETGKEWTPRRIGASELEGPGHDNGQDSEAEKPARSAPVCAICNDTHRMDLGESHGIVMCTHCPSPCLKCGAGGSYCTTTPCDCACHRR